MLRHLKRNTRSIFSSLNIFLLLFQSFLPGFLLFVPTNTYAVEKQEIGALDLEFSQDSYEFDLTVAAKEDVLYELTYVVAASDESKTQAGAKGVAISENGVAEAKIFAGTCSTDNTCTQDTVLAGNLSLPEAEYSTDFVLLDEVLWLSGDNLATVPSVELGVVYKAPQNNEVQVTFTKLPENPGSLTIEEITLTDEQAKKIGAYSTVAYDITSNMPNGSFEYELQLPLPEGADEKASVVYAENITELVNNIQATVVETEKVIVDSKENLVSVSELDHFTVFVVVPSDIVSSISASSIQGWRMTKQGNSQISLADMNDYPAIPNSFGQHSIKMNRPGTSGTHRSYLGYFEVDKTLSDIQEITWNRYSKVGNDTYLNIFLRNGLQTATVLYYPSITLNTWEEETFNSTSTGIQIRVGGSTQNISFTDLMNTYGNWNIENHCISNALTCLFSSGSTKVGGIVFVSGSTSPTAAQEHYYDGVTVDFVDQDLDYFDFVDALPVVLSQPINQGWNLRSQSILPGEKPVDIVCGGTTDGDFSVYGNGQTAHNWESSDSIPGLNFQRQWQWPDSGVWTTDSTIYSATNTSFATFGSPAGTEGTWNTRVRSWLDQNANNVFDEGVDIVSDWSNECSVTYDTTPPATPTGLRRLGADGNIYQCSDLSVRQNMVPMWDANTTDSDFSHYEYSSFHPNGSQGLNEQVLTDPELANTWVAPTDGTYGFAVRAVDTTGNKSGWALSAESLAGSCQITYDSTAPTQPVITKPTAEQYFTSTPILNEWTAASDTGSGVDRYQVAYLYDDLHTFGGSTCAGEEIDDQTLSGCRDVTGLTRNHIPALSEQGGVKIWVRAIDTVGNVGEWSESVHYFYDATAPVAPELVSPPNNSVVNGASITQSWSTTDADIHHYIYESYHNAAATPEDLRWHEEIAATSKTATNVAEATYWWRVRAVDHAGNVGPWSSLWKITVDNTVETPVITAPNEGDSFNSSPIRAEWNAVSDASGIEKYEIKYEYLISGVPTTAYSEVAGTVLYRDQILSGSVQGDFTIQVRAYDVLGNISDWSEAVTYTYDSVKPSSTITTFDLPDEGEVQTSEFDGLIQGTATDPEPSSGLSEVLLEIMHTPFGATQSAYWNGTDWQETQASVSATLDSSGSNITWQYQIAPEEKVIEGIYQVTSHALDNAGNLEETYTITIVYDVTIPEVTLTIDPVTANGKRGWYITQPTVTLQATDNYDVAQIQYQWNSTVGTWIEYTTPLNPPGQGQNILYYRSIDSANNISGVGIKEIKFDQENPTEAFDMNVSVSGKNAKITWKEASDNIFVYGYSISARNEALSIERSESVASDKREYEFTNLEDGEWVFSVRTEDTAGNNGSFARKSATIGSSGTVAGATQEIANNLLSGISTVLGVGTTQANQTTTEDDSTAQTDPDSDDALESQTAGAVLGESDDQCVAWKFYLPLFLLLIQVLFAVSLEIANRDPSLKKLLFALIISGLTIAGFYIFRDMGCYTDTTGLMQSLAQWFIPVSVLLGFILRGIGSLTVEEK